MSLPDLIIFFLSIVGAIAGHFLLVAPYSWLVVTLCALFGAWSLFGEAHAGNVVVRMGGLSWSMEDFVRGWLITGRTGSGKTQSGINTITSTSVSWPFRSKQKCITHFQFWKR